MRTADAQQPAQQVNCTNPHKHRRAQCAAGAMLEGPFSFGDAIAAGEAKSGVTGWQAYRVESHEGGFTVTGCIPAGTYTKGARKGQPRYNHPLSTHHKTVVVSYRDIAEQASRHRATTGQCWFCVDRNTSAAAASQPPSPEPA